MRGDHKLEPLLIFLKRFFILEKDDAMPIKIPDSLPAFDTLTKENIFVMDEKRATSQDMRPIKIVILTLMPTKIAT